MNITLTGPAQSLAREIEHFSGLALAWQRQELTQLRPEAFIGAHTWSALCCKKQAKPLLFPREVILNAVDKFCSCQIIQDPQGGNGWGWMRTVTCVSLTPACLWKKKHWILPSDNTEPQLPRQMRLDKELRKKSVFHNHCCLIMY